MSPTLATCRRRCLLWALVYIGCFCAVIRLPAAPPANYYLVWSDEFNGTSLDDSKWVRWGGVDQGATLAVNAASVAGGNLTVTTYTSNSIHYTAIISTEGRLRVKYGYLESRIQFNDVSGTWSGFWLNAPRTGKYLGDPSASGSEMDIVEHRRANKTNSDISGFVQSAVHWDGYGPQHKQTNDFPAGSGLGAGFHTYGLLWDRSRQNFSIDGVTVFRPMVGHSDRSEIILLSSEVNGATWAGRIPPGGYGDLMASTNKMVVDYVRYYAPVTTVFWTGAASADWTDAGNWLDHRVPVPGADVQFSYLAVSNFSTVLKRDFTLGSLSLMEAHPFSITTGTLMIGSGGIDMVSASDDATIDSTIVLRSPQIWKIGEDRMLRIKGTVQGGGRLTKSGLGTVLLEGQNSYRGTTTISNGTMTINGRLSSKSVIVTGGTLSGTGTITGKVIVKSGATLAPGALALGTLSIGRTLELQAGSVTRLRLDKTAGACDKITGLSSLTCGGTLVLPCVAGVLASGDAFKLFDARTYSGTFAGISPAAPGPGLAWDPGTLSHDGTLRVVNASAPIFSR